MTEVLLHKSTSMALPSTSLFQLPYLAFLLEVNPFSGKKARTGGLRNFEEFGFSFLGFSSEISLISHGKYFLWLVTIVNKVNH